eukprot:CAMPEP_0198370720 /NCGR_PEP_ID=MMETSP1450-20131203/156860_1 /TAXON_ID=753684 ORGANISM="Madagascaria erythrocladiodes, Strain CCMP3234" /NCGR_SAMPLE_ID=MMETSP1450 /ASSEMBLY_ACC=CAM_ASM_001115 /LENGTH=266 /DNA_ID=CAMNT_0044078263 /DNA_START=82 /DNA_END=882 /DNA_ORIENTATION=+
MAPVAFLTSPPPAAGSSAASSFLGGRRPAVAATARRHTPTTMQFDVGKAFGGLVDKAKEAASSAADGLKKPKAEAKAPPQAAPAPPKAAPPKPKVVAEERPVEEMIMEPQPGEPGYVAPKEEKKFEFADGPPPGPPSKQKGAQTEKRGFDLLKEDFLKSAPERVGVGRQDITFTYAPQAGEPGYVPKATERVKVSELSVSPFEDDSNFGGKDEVEKSAEEVLKKKAVPKVKAVAKVEEVQKEFDVPDYLKPLPEDSPRRGYTWKNW